MKKNLRFLTVALMILAGVVAWYFLARNTVGKTIEFPGQTVESASGPQSPAEVLNPEKKEAQELSSEEANSAEIIFQKEVSFEFTKEGVVPNFFRIVVDGASRDIKCPSTVGFIALAGGHRAYIQCQMLDNIVYGTVMVISYFNAKGVRIQKEIFQHLIYEGITSDRRSWIFREPKSQNLVIETVSFESSYPWRKGEDADDVDHPTRCERQSHVLVWNQDLQDFDENRSDAPLVKVKRPIVAAKGCFNASGEWKGL